MAASDSRRESLPLVRNLLAGRATLERLGAVAPPVLYSPDSFGHPAAAPLLALEFGLDLAIVWRGYGGRRWPAGVSAGTYSYTPAGQ